MLARVDGELQLNWFEAVITWLRDADNRGVVTVLVSAMALLLSGIAYIWPRKAGDSVDKNKTAKSTGSIGRQPGVPQPGTSRTTARSAAVLVGIFALIGISYGIYKAVSLGRDEIVVRYTACLGEYERNCGFNHDVYLYCYADAAAYIKEKDQCLRVSANAIGSHDGNKCGYTNVSVLCTKKTP